LNFYVQILGSGAAVPSLKRNCAGQFIFCNNRHILIDCGEGTQIQLRKNQIHFQRISHILISHLHGDHFFGLPGLISTMSLLGRQKGITIYGPKNIRAILLSMLEATGNKLSFELSVVELEHTSSQIIFEDDIIKISAFPLKHRIPTYGFIIAEKEKAFKINKQACDEKNIGIHLFQKLKMGESIQVDGELIENGDLTFPPNKSYSYAHCSDTIFDHDLIPILRNVDVLFHESTFLERHKERANETFHSTAKQAAMIARKSSIRKLILGHFSSRYKDENEFLNEASTVFTNTIAAFDGLKIEIDGPKLG
jgi:ribonuclease Z